MTWDLREALKRILLELSQPPKIYCQALVQIQIPIPVQPNPNPKPKAVPKVDIVKLIVSLRRCAQKLI